MAKSYNDGYSKAENDYHRQSEKDRQTSYNCGYEAGYRKAIDDFMLRVDETAKRGSFDMGGYNDVTESVVLMLKEIKEQLREGVDNE